MKNNTQHKFNELTENLQQIIKVYRDLLNNLKNEREILVKADLNDLNENNKNKEKILVRAGDLEKKRVVLAKELADQEGYKKKDIKLLSLAAHLDFERGDTLRNLHSALVLLLKRAKETNDQNEALVGAALENVTGAMKSIKNKVAGEGAYAVQSKVEDGHTAPEKLVSRKS